jgi:hypothetical protein
MHLSSNNASSGAMISSIFFPAQLAMQVAEAHDSST